MEHYKDQREEDYKPNEAAEDEAAIDHCVEQKAMVDSINNELDRIN